MDTCIWYLSFQHKSWPCLFNFKEYGPWFLQDSDIPDGWIKVYVPKQQNQILGLCNTVYMYVRQHVQKYNLPH